MVSTSTNSGKLHVVVIGAGIVGASIAFHLSLRNVRVTILEALEPGTVCSGHSFAWINSFEKEPATYHDLNRRSIDMWDRFARRLGVDVGLRWGGRLTWETTEQGARSLRERVGLLQARGYPSRIIDVEELNRLEPDLCPGKVTAVALNDIDGQVDPPKVVRACLQQAGANSATTHVDTPVTGLTLDGGRVRAVVTPLEEIECDAVVIAAGVGTTDLAAAAGVHVPQIESPGVVVRTRPVRRMLQTVSVLYAPAIDSDHPEIHLRQGTDGSLMIGEGTQESLSRNDSQEHADDLLGRAAHFLPRLAGTDAIPVPVGYRPMPADGLPVLGFAGAVPNLYIAVMHSGVTLAALVGETAALEIADGARVEILDRYRPERFSGQPV